MSMMVEVACPISWTSMALLYRTSLSRRVSSAGLTLVFDGFYQRLAFQPLGLKCAEPNSEMEAIRVRKHQEEKERTP